MLGHQQSVDDVDASKTDAIGYDPTSDTLRYWSASDSATNELAFPLKEKRRWALGWAQGFFSGTWILLTIIMIIVQIGVISVARDDDRADYSPYEEENVMLLPLDRFGRYTAFAIVGIVVFSLTFITDVRASGNPKVGLPYWAWQRRPEYLSYFGHSSLRRRQFWTSFTVLMIPVRIGAFVLNMIPVVKERQHIHEESFTALWVACVINVVMIGFIPLLSLLAFLGRQVRDLIFGSQVQLLDVAGVDYAALTSRHQAAESEVQREPQAWRAPGAALAVPPCTFAQLQRIPLVYYVPTSEKGKAFPEDESPAQPNPQPSVDAAPPPTKAKAVKNKKKKTDEAWPLEDLYSPRHTELQSIDETAPATAPVMAEVTDAGGLYDTIASQERSKATAVDAEMVSSKVKDVESTKKVPPGYWEGEGDTDSESDPGSMEMERRMEEKDKHKVKGKLDAGGAEAGSASGPSVSFAAGSSSIPDPAPQQTQPPRLPASERSRLQRIGMSGRRRRNRRLHDAETSAAALPTALLDASSTSTMRLRARPPLLAHPLLSLPDNLAVCTICMCDFDTPDRALLEERPSIAGRFRRAVGIVSPTDVEPLRLLPCRHALHRECVDEWLTTESAKCPNCQAPVFGNEP